MQNKNNSKPPQSGERAVVPANHRQQNSASELPVKGVRENRNNKNQHKEQESSNKQKQQNKQNPPKNKDAVQKQPQNQKNTKKQTSKAKNEKPEKSGAIGKVASSLSLYGSISPKDLRRRAGLRIAFLGGINEIGKNLTLLEYNNEMIIIDAGMSFPDADMPGIDYVLPDLTYVVSNAKKIKGIFITHGHEDHIGGLPYLLKAVNVPVYATCLTIGLIQGKLKEHRMLNSCKLKVIKPGDVIKTGEFSVKAIHVNHSIPDAVAFAIRSSAGTIVHTGDFKIDNTPIDGGVIDLAEFARLGNEGVLCLLSDSTNAERAGYTPSEKNVGETLESLFVKAKGKRIIVASFASNIHRIQQIVDASQKVGRKIFLSGRSLENVTAISTKLGYLNIPEGLLVPIDNLKNYSDENVVLITTGSQGEPMSALSRMALCDHRKVSIGDNDFVIISATPIPGNEKTVANTINELMKLGADVVYEKSLGIHVSGHAAQEEQKLIINLVHPKYFIPVHGEQKHLRRHAALAASVGIPEENIMIPDLGAVIELSENYIVHSSTVPSGKVFVDGTGVGDVGSVVLRDRKKLSEEGIVIISAVTDAYSGELVNPIDIQTKGFVFQTGSEELQNIIVRSCEKIFDNFVKSVDMDLKSLQSRLKDTVSKAIFDKTRRSPVIIVTVLDV